MQANNHFSLKKISIAQQVTLFISL